MMITDFHTHILPQIDDGSSSLEESLNMLRLEAEQGVQRVVLTPHFYPDRDDPEEFLIKRQNSFTQLAAAGADQQGLPEMVLGAEVYFYTGMAYSESLQQLTLGNTPYIMVEMPLGEWTDSILRELEGLSQRQGLTPVLAHIERYLRPLQVNKLLRRLEDLPVLIQANSSFFLDPYSRKLALKLLKKEKIDLLGSDCHNMQFRPPLIGEMLKSIPEKQLLDHICSTQLQIFTP